VSPLHVFLTGAIAAASFVIALFLLRFWRATRDGFFLLFALSFALEGVDRAAPAFPQLADDNPVLYGVRLLAYALILVAIWQKNRR
jgi:hypothetical protein